jgi:ATP-dependent DNA ligase I
VLKTSLLKIYINGGDFSLIMKYLYLVDLYKKLESTSKRLEKTYYLSEFLKEIEVEELGKFMLLLQGTVFELWDPRKIGVAAKLIIKAINLSSGIDVNTIENEWKQTGDLGITAHNLIGKKKQVTLFNQVLTVDMVFSNLQKLSELEGQGTVDRKVQLISELLTSAQPEEAKYVVRTVLEELRVGLGAGTIRDAIVWAYLPRVAGIFVKCSCGEVMPMAERCLKCGEKIKTKFKEECEKFDGLKIDNLSDFKDLDNYKFIIPSDEKVGRDAHNYFIDLVQRAYDLTTDFGEVARIAKQDGWVGLLDVDLEILKPFKVMLFLKVKDVVEAFGKVGKPAAFEYKYDGFRTLVHKKNDNVKLFTRRLEDVSKQFPEVVKAIKEHVKCNSAILDAEIVGMQNGKYVPFQKISQRIKRKHDIEKLAKDLPVMIRVFDTVMIDGEDILKKGFIDRRKALETNVAEVEGQILWAEQLITDDEVKAQDFYQKALDAGLEGMMVKSLDAPYKPGARVGFGVKVKPTMENLDLAIVGAEWGEGKRSGWFTSFTLACYDEEKGSLVEIGKVGTGVKELEGDGVTFEELTNMLKPLVLEEKGKEVKVKPQIIIEIAYEEIQKSPSYSSGYALRFPRVIRLRTEERSEPSDLNYVEDLYFGQ